MVKNFFSAIFNLFFRFYKLIIVSFAVMGFFVYYNVFLIDTTLEGLKYSLEQTAVAYDIEDIGGLDMLITKAISKEIPPYDLVSRANVVNLEYAKSIAELGKSFKQLSHMKVALNTAIKEKEKQRGAFLTFLDKINQPIREGVIHLAYLIRSLVGPRAPEEAPLELGVDLFGKLRITEEGKDLKELAVNYKNFIDSYPEYQNISLAKLKLAYTYQRLGEYDVAKDLYKEIEEKYPAKKEAAIARVFLGTLERKTALLNKVNSLIIECYRIPAENIEKKQKIFYGIGMIYLELFNLKEATKFFKRSIGLNPDSHEAMKAQYNMAWVAKERNDYETSMDGFSKLAKMPDTNLVFDSLYQVADIQHRRGDYEDFIALSVKLAENYKAYATIASLCLFQAGASYMYDLNDPEKAEEIFARLVREYPDSPYARYLAPVSPVGVFVTYLVPRATRVVAWRIMGLLCLSGYTGEIFKFTAESKEAGFNMGVNDWLKQELPDTLGNIYVDIKGHETDLEKEKATTQGRITMGQFNVHARGEWGLGVTEGKTLDLIIKKAFLEKIPIPPVLLNNSLRGVKEVIEKNFPVQVTKAYIGKDVAGVEGFGSRAALNRLKHDMEILFMADFKIEKIKKARERQRIYDLFRKKFPEGDFAVRPSRSTEDMFLDFLTRVSLYSTFKILETIKDSKLDFERSVRTLGRLMMKKENFRVDFKETRINADLARFIEHEFPWVIDEAFLIDIKSLEVDFKKNGDVKFDAHIGLGYGDSLDIVKALKPEDITVKGTMLFEIDEESGIPRWVFKEISLNKRRFLLLDKLNMLTLRCLNMLKDENIPLALEEVTPYEGGIVFKGKGAGDFTARLFYDPHPFVIFQIRRGDLTMAGLRRLKKPVTDKEALYFRGRRLQKLSPREKKRLKKKQR
jgi:tetratricopeptide (TPR) repeat protein